MNKRDQAKSGKRGGQSHSDAKRKAARANGCKGGRPRKDGSPAEPRHISQIFLRRELSDERWRQVCRAVYSDLGKREQALFRRISRKDLKQPSEHARFFLMKFRWLARRHLAELERTGTVATT